MDKMTTISQTTFWKEYLWMKILVFDQISLKFVHKVPVDDNSALIQVIAWGRTADKPLPEPMPSQFTNAYIRH